MDLSFTPRSDWSDSTAITAQDIVWSWQRLVSPATASPYASYHGNMHIANAREIALGQKGPETLGVKALNDTTLQVTLTQPNAAFGDAGAPFAGTDRQSAGGAVCR